jgi:hypothetical protein
LVYNRDIRRKRMETVNVIGLVIQFIIAGTALWAASAKH